MAEGGGFTSVRDGSDADFEIVCAPCGEDNIREEAVKFCVECNQYLCTACARYHRRIAALKSHKLLDTDDAKIASVSAIVTKCRYHPDRDIEMFCGTHDMVCCLKCIATEHRTCESVKNIEDVTTPFVQQNEIQGLKDETKAVRDQLIAANKKKQTNVDSFEEQKKEILRNIQDIERKIIEHIGKLKREAVESLNKRYSEINREMEAEITLTANTITEVDKSTSMLQTVSNMDARQQFVQMKLIQRTVKDAKKLFEESESQGTRVARFIENADLKTVIMTVTELGRFETMNKNQKLPTPKQYQMKSMKEIKVRMPNDSYDCYISDTCQLPDGTIILTDYLNRKVKWLDTNYNVKCHCDLKANPRDICCTTKNEVAVKMNNHKVQFISVDSSLAVLKDISIEGGSYWGMAYIAGDLWVSTRSGINVYSRSGTLLKSIKNNVNGQRIFKSSPQHIAASRENVIVADGSDGAMCLGRDGKVKSDLRDGRLNFTQGVCVSSDGTVFLPGSYSHNIVMFSDDGNCKGELLTQEMGITYPGSLYYDNKRNCLIIACHRRCDSIYILEMCD
ncbi:uncharacterized protein LOC128551993 [Mercenaria mercenaria]|uniref:uncharacterized protein LOC128551993 n=1 Tax=Mercenaria mercenaria TaxID=6596 RepID=UPI00234EC69A|nr:uncharacterized protein LOC128551993 [Mercenaria mercenaria]XP_053388952.1 uncharacterized protein LOC128551993 [Mercenaria mercenaria]